MRFKRVGGIGVEGGVKYSYLLAPPLPVSDPGFGVSGFGGPRFRSGSRVSGPVLGSRVRVLLGPVLGSRVRVSGLGSGSRVSGPGLGSRSGGSGIDPGFGSGVRFFCLLVCSGCCVAASASQGRHRLPHAALVAPPEQLLQEHHGVGPNSVLLFLA